LATRRYFVLLLCLAGCVTNQAVEDKVRLYNDDGVAMFSQGRFLDARESFELALQLSPHDADLLFNLAECHDRLGNYAMAEQYYVLCLQKSANNADARYALGILYYKTGRQADAQKLIDQWLVEQPKNPEPYALDGWRLRQERDHTRALGRLQQANGLDPQNVHALTELAILYETMCMPDRALVLYERALARNPNQPEVVVRLAQLRARNVGPPQPD